MGTTETPTIPMIVSVDDHVVEPADLWARWLPERYRDRAPRIERKGLAGMQHIGGGTYELEFADDAPQADCWVYEDLILPHKRHVAAVGFDRDDMTASPITYDEMRPGCYEPKARVEDMLMNHVEVSVSFPTFPRFCGQTFAEAKDKDLAMACVLAYNDWMVEEWCGDSDGHLIPLCIIPLWDVEHRRRGDPSQRRTWRARRLLQRDPPAPRAPEHPHRLLGPDLRRRAQEPTSPCACTSARRRRCPPRRSTRRSQSRQRCRSTTRWRR